MSPPLPEPTRTAGRIHVLAPIALSPYAEAELAQRFIYSRLTTQPDPEQFLREHGGEIQAVAVGGAAGFPDTLWDSLPALRIIVVHGVGTDRIDMATASRRGITVATTPDILSHDVADLAIGLWIGLCRKLASADRFVRAGHWRAGQDFPLGRQVTGQRVGVVGLGRIGTAIARRCEAFAASIAYTAMSPQPDCVYTFYPDARALAMQSDALFIAVPSGPSTRSLIGRAVLDALGPEGVLINIARGSVIDEAALIAALRNGAIAGAGLDVFVNEPAIDPAFMELENVLLAPHIGSATVQVRKRMAAILAEQLTEFFTR